MEKVAITLHIPKEQHSFLTQIQKQLRQTQGRKVALSEILYNFAQIGLGFAQNKDEFVQNLKQNEQNILQSTQNLSAFTQNLLKITEDLSKNCTESTQTKPLNNEDFNQLFKQLREQQRQFLKEYNEFLAEREEYEKLKIELREELEYSQRLERENRTMTNTIDHLYKTLEEKASQVAELIHFRDHYYALQKENNQLHKTLSNLTDELKTVNQVKDILHKIQDALHEISLEQSAIKSTINKSDNQLSQWLPTLITAAAALYDKIPKDKLTSAKKQLTQLVSDTEEPEPTDEA